MNVWTRLGVLLGAALATSAHAAGFFLLGDAGRLPWVAVAVQLAALVSWPVLGLLLVALAGRWGTPGAWFDRCLSTIVWGEWVLALGTGLNIAVWLGAAVPWPAQLGLHAGVVGASAAVMLWRYLRLCRRAGAPLGRSLAAWVIGLNLTFAAALVPLLHALDAWSWLVGAQLGDRP